MSKRYNAAGFPRQRRALNWAWLAPIAAVLVIGIVAALVLWSQQSGTPAAGKPSSPAVTSTSAPSTPSASLPTPTQGKVTSVVGPPAFDAGLLKQVVAFESAYWSTSYRQTAAQRASTLTKVIAADFDDELAPSSLGANQAQAALVASQTVQTAQVLPSGIALAQSSINTATSRATVTLRKTTAGGNITQSSLVDISQWTRTTSGWRVTDHYIAEGGEGP